MEKWFSIVLVILVGMLYDYSYKGIILQSIHENTSKVSINFDGNEAIVFGSLTYIVGTYLLYLILGLFKKKDKDEKVN
jgi:hypothetical protein